MKFNTPSRAKLTLLPLIAATYFMVAGGPYGLEDIIQMAGYTGALLLFFVTPLIWSLPTAMMVGELASAIPEEGGFYIWATRGLGKFWGFQEVWLTMAGRFFEMALYPTLFVDYLGHFAPVVSAHSGASRKSGSPWLEVFLKWPSAQLFSSIASATSPPPSPPDIAAL